MSFLALFAIAYRYVVTTSALGREQATVHHVIVSGMRLRVDVDADPNEAIMYDVLLSNDGGKTMIAINTRNKTWFDPGKIGGTGFTPAEPKKITASLVAESKEPIGSYE